MHNYKSITTYFDLVGSSLAYPNSHKPEDRKAEAKTLGDVIAQSTIKINNWRAYGQ